MSAEGTLNAGAAPPRIARVPSFQALARLFLERSPAASIWLCCAVLAAGSGCAAWGRVTAGSGDYELYRQTRLASTLEQRLSASHRYLSEQPEGRWRSEVEAWYEQAEPRYFERARDSVERLESYLELLPGGPHEKAAEQRIQELELSQKYEREREQRVLDRARVLRERLELAVRERREFLEAVRARVEALSAFDAFGKDLTHVPRVLASDATCEVTRCSQTVTFSFTIPEAGELRSRKAELETVVHLSGNVVAALELRGGGLFSRVGEAVQVRPVSGGDLQARVEAIGIAVQLVQNAVEAAFPEASCGAEPVSPVVLARQCAAKRLNMVAGFEADELDRLVVEPAGATPPS